jgi:hypothetical protein
MRDIMSEHGVVARVPLGHPSKSVRPNGSLASDPWKGFDAANGTPMS